MERKSVDFSKALKASARFWGGGDGLGLGLFLIPVTAAWYLVAGVPVDNGAPRDDGEKPSP